MTNLNIIENKISAIRKYLAILKNYQKLSRSTIGKDVTLRGAVERYLYLVVQATIDLAEAVIAYKKYRKPSVYSEAFDILYEEKIITESLHEKLVLMTGFRNIIAHDYEKVDFTVVHSILRDNLKDISSFISQIKKKVKV